jgi:lysophospholipase L1-like esterase
MKKLFYIISCAVALGGCKPRLEMEVPSAGDADFSRYIAVGNSLTAGYADNSLYRSGQQNSYPSILAAQFASVGGGDFKQPLLPGDHGYPGAKLVLYWKTNCAGVKGLTPGDYNGAADTNGSYVSIAAQGPYNNLGVPGIRAIDYLLGNYATFVATFGGANYAQRFYQQPNKRPLDELIYTMEKVKPTFFTCWLGSNDVLGYATSGGEGNAPGTPVFGLILLEDISPIDMFRENYDSVVNNLVKNGAKGALINIPDITAIPHFTTVPPMGLKLTQQEADDLNVANLMYPHIHFTAGDNFFLIADETAPGGKRHIKANEFIRLAKGLPDSIRCAGWGKTKPIAQDITLDEEEIANVKKFTADFNQIILEAARKHNLAYVDMNSFLKTVSAGMKYNGVDYTTEYISGGAFSLDGVHLTPRGYALVANEIIKVINTTYNAKIPFADVNSYPGLRFP